MRASIRGRRSLTFARGLVTNFPRTPGAKAEACWFDWSYMCLHQGKCSGPPTDMCLLVLHNSSAFSFPSSRETRRPPMCICIPPSTLPPCATTFLRDCFDSPRVNTSHDSQVA